MSSVEIKNIILESLKQYNPLFIGLFGSYARDEQTTNSDIDIPCIFSKRNFFVETYTIRE